ncbi:MAG: hypothetical protein CR979_02000 [Propionibacterium sp.]|nr:MAG: hypothetical protein CR979_02000 [Propionibacterium sp.]
MTWRNLGPADAALRSKGVYWIDWNAKTGDASAKRPKSLSEMTRLATRHHGARVVLLAHDTADKKLTLWSLRGIIRFYRTQGYQFGVIS